MRKERVTTVKTGISIVVGNGGKDNPQFHPELGPLKNAASALRHCFAVVLVTNVFLAATTLRAQNVPNPPLSTPPVPGQPAPGLSEQQRKDKAAAELRAQEHQRILGVMPNFNTSNVQDAEPLTAARKFELAAKGALDPFTFMVAGLDAGLSQGENSFPEYGQGAVGYGKRFGASYADSFDSTMLGNALFPVLLKQDPRYFRKATGSFGSRLWYAIYSTVRCRDDDGRWAPNYSNVLGNIAAGGISNLYYPSADRGAGLTFERAATVTAEGAIGAAFIEFWPDISRKMFPKRHVENSP
jgi:hypothetical protein